MNIFQNIFKKYSKRIKKSLRPDRERLRMLYFIETNKALYEAYETQTTGYDWVNIEIEEKRNFIKKLILKDEIADDSWGCMGGDSFYSLVIDSRNHLLWYIKQKNEKIVFESELL
jgi:hypothetical protein